VLVVGPEETKQAIKLPNKIANKKPVFESLEVLVGPENIKLS